MKKIICLILIIISLFSLFSCNNSTNNNNQNTDIYLEEDIDYIDHAMTYDGKELSYDESKWYINMLDKVPLPDPQVFVEDDTYYIVGTSDRNNNVVDCYTTEDFVDFELHKAIYDPSKFDGWEHNTQPTIYAPEIYNFDGKYYMYYSAQENTNKKVRRMSVVVADDPLGPYEPIVNDKVDGLNNPLFYNEEIQYMDFGEYATTLRALDATIFVDNDKQMYMYYVMGGIYGFSNKYNYSSPQYIVGVKMINPYQVDWSTHKTLVVPGTIDSQSEEIKLEWETYRDSTVDIAEAPYMIKSNGKYYLTYSVNGCWNKYYNVCYAVSDSPLGNYIKPYEEGQLWTNILMGYPGTLDPETDLYNQWSGFASGTGHHCFFKAGDELMIGYHAHQNRNWNKGKDQEPNQYTPRYFALDYVHFDSNGVPFVNGPTYSIQPLPEVISGYGNIMKNAVITTENVINEEMINDDYVVDCYNLEESDNEVILGEGKSIIEIEFDDEYIIGGIVVYNSAYFDKIVTEIEYIDFGNGNKIYYPQFSTDIYVDYDKEFVRPASAFTIDILKYFKADKVTICFNLPDGGNINEIVILGA